MFLSTVNYINTVSISVLPKIQSKLLSSIPHVTHAFYTRNGGVSKGNFESLSVSSSDNPDYVKQNMELIRNDLNGDAIYFNKQTHSTEIFDVTKEKGPKNSGDGLITKKTDVLLGVKTADCMPVLFAHPKKKLVAGIHAGWKGLLKGIIEQAIKQLSADCDISKLYCAIGPCLSQENFEVGPEVLEVAAYNEFFHKKTQNSWLFDMKGYGKHVLELKGIKHIDIIDEDTYSQPDKFF